VEVAERFADDGVTEKELMTALWAAADAQDEPGHTYVACWASSIACTAVRIPLDLAYGDAILRTPSTAREVLRRTFSRKAEAQYQAELLRCVVGNPFRPALLDPSLITPKIRAMSQTIYEDRRYEDLPLLVDELEDAGCDNADLLTHLRGPGPHTRGCWALDILLGKE